MNYRLSTPEEIDLVASYIANDYKQCTQNLPNMYKSSSGILANTDSLENNAIDMFLEYKKYSYSTLETEFGYKLVVLLHFSEDKDGKFFNVFTCTYAVFPDNKVCDITSLDSIHKKENFESLTKSIEECKYFDSLSPEEQQNYFFNEENAEDE